ncbi:hypothetical protein GEMRC1_010492 [Eukaryota sp. GEM-RC1]
MSKAVKTAKKVASIQSLGEKQKTKAHRRTSTKFRRPKTLALPRNPRFPHFVRTAPINKIDKYSLIRQPLTTEAAMKLIEDQNTLVFVVDKRAKKHGLAKSIKELYNVTPARINTMNGPNGEKKAYVRLVPTDEAVVVANSIGLL